VVDQRSTSDEKGQRERGGGGIGSRRAHTGGEVVLKSSEPAEWELDGVNGGILMNW